MTEILLRDSHAASARCNAFGPPLADGVIRWRSEDFRVVEKLGFEADGDGEHLLLEVEKTDCNTDWVAKQMAKSLQLQRSAVSYAGMKDRRAITRQFFSIHLPGQPTPEPDQLRGPGFEILGISRHRRKLRRGALAENEFEIRIRELEGDLQGVEKRLEQLRECGCPNFFGPQRFGRDGNNLGLAWRCLVDGQRFGSRERRSLVFSSARAALFDLVLARRVRLGNWNCFIDGDLAMLERSRSIFAADGDDDELRRRLDSLEIHPAGPMPGRETASGDDNERLRLEAEVLQPFDAMIKGLVRSGVDAQRRSLRLVPRGLTWDFDASGLVVKFRLRPGGFATTVLREVVRARVVPG